MSSGQGMTLAVAGNERECPLQSNWSRLAELSFRQRRRPPTQSGDDVAIDLRDVDEGLPELSGEGERV